MGRAAWCMKLITRLMVVLTNHTCKHDLMVKGFIILVYCINNYSLKCSTDRHINARSTEHYQIWSREYLRTTQNCDFPLEALSMAGRDGMGGYGGEG